LFPRLGTTASTSPNPLDFSSPTRLEQTKKISIVVFVDHSLQAIFVAEGRGGESFARLGLKPPTTVTPDVRERYLEIYHLNLYRKEWNKSLL
jgi:hypothetical protein